MSNSHPQDIAEDWVAAFSRAPLCDTLYAKQLTPPLKALTVLHTKVMPWKVRLSVLVTGQIPRSYLEDFSGDF